MNGTTQLTLIAGGIFVAGLVVGYRARRPVVKNETTTESDPKSALPPYLKNNSWEEELNYKLWSTKGSRFSADKRCAAKARWSQRAITLLTTYIIIIGILPLLPEPLGKIFSPEILSFTTTSISIALLAYSLLESGFNYALKSHQFHECGLRIGKIYAELRQAKELAESADRRKEMERITESYQTILEAYENHEPIDLETFQTCKPEYFKLRPWDCWLIWIKYFVFNILFYILLIVLPVVFIFWLIWKTQPQ